MQQITNTLCADQTIGVIPLQQLLEERIMQHTDEADS